MVSGSPCLQGEPYLLQISSATESSTLSELSQSLGLWSLLPCRCVWLQGRSSELWVWVWGLPAFPQLSPCSRRKLKMLKPKASTVLHGLDSSPPGQSSLLCLDTSFLHLLRISTVWTLSRCLWRKRELASPWEASLLRASFGCWYASKNSLEGIQPRSPQQRQDIRKSQE